MLKAVAVAAAAVAAAVAMYRIAPHAPATPLHADAPGTAGLQGEPAAFQVRR